MTTAVDSWLDEAIEELEANGFAPDQPDTQPAPPSWDDPPWNPTEVTIRVRDYVTREFEEGKAGNRDYLPTTYEVAKKCVRGAGNAKSCRIALRHLQLLAAVGEIIRVHDSESVSEEGTPLRHCTFWALPDSGSEAGDGIPVAVTVSALEPWQIDLIRDIDNAPLASSVGKGVTHDERR